MDTPKNVEEVGYTPEEATLINAHMSVLPTRAEHYLYEQQAKCNHRFRTNGEGATCRKCGTQIAA